MSIAKWEDEITTGLLIVAAVVAAYFIFGNKLRRTASDATYTFADWTRRLAGWFEKPLYEAPYAKIKTGASGGGAPEIPGTGFTAAELLAMGYTNEQLNEIVNPNAAPYMYDAAAIASGEVGS